MNRVNELEICVEDYKSRDEFEQAVRKAVMVLLDNGYVISAKWDSGERYVVWIKYDYADEEIGGCQPKWLTPGQIDALEDLGMPVLCDGTIDTSNVEYRLMGSAEEPEYEQLSFDFEVKHG